MSATRILRINRLDAGQAGCPTFTAGLAGMKRSVYPAQLIAQLMAQFMAQCMVQFTSAHTLYTCFA
jgi:hypothetical protein